MPPKLRVLLDTKNSFSSEYHSLDSNSSNSDKTCTHVFTRGQNKDQRCGNKLPENRHQHGNDRYCSTCQSKDPIKALLESEIACECETHDCYDPVLKVKSLPRQYGDERFCRFCLANNDIQHKLLLEQELEENEKLQEQQKSMKKQEEKFDLISCNKYNTNDLLRLHESLGKPILETNKVKNYLSEHARYLIEVILCDHPSELARVLMWASTLLINNPITSINSKILKGQLILLKQEIVNRLVTYMKDVKFPSAKIKARKDIIQQLCAKQYKLSSEAIDLFEYEVEIQRVASNPLNRFIADRIRITGNKNNSLFTEAIFQAFLEWAQQQNDKDTLLQHKMSKRSDMFGKGLKKHLLEEEDGKSLWHIGKYGSKTCHFGIQLIILKGQE
jgi:hypothetical protein